MKIEYLAEHMEHIPLLAKWAHAEWGYLSPAYTLEERTERLHGRATRQGIPVSFIAIDDDKPVGSANLVECDMHSRSHLKPWLSSLYVHSTARRHGVGEALLSRVIHEAQQQGFPALYLWTPTEEKYYEKRGWAVIERTIYKNENAVIMEHLLTLRRPNEQS